MQSGVNRLPSQRQTETRRKPSFIPTAALDSHRGRQVMELFAQVAHDQGAGVIVVTHDHRALDVFDTIYEMEDGVIQQVKAK